MKCWFRLFTGQNFAFFYPQLRATFHKMQSSFNRKLLLMAIDSNSTCVSVCVCVCMCCVSSDDVQRALITFSHYLLERFLSCFGIWCVSLCSWNYLQVSCSLASSSSKYHIYQLIFLSWRELGQLPLSRGRTPDDNNSRYFPYRQCSWGQQRVVISGYRKSLLKTQVLCS